jgi:hypothetical protein
VTLHVYRFLGSGLTQVEAELRKRVASTSTAYVSAHADTQVVDVTEDDANLPDLQAAMATLGLVFDSTDPLTAPNTVVADTLGTAAFDVDTILVDDVLEDELVDDVMGNVLVNQ